YLDARVAVAHEAVSDFESGRMGCLACHAVREAAFVDLDHRTGGAIAIRAIAPEILLHPGVGKIARGESCGGRCKQTERRQGCRTGGEYAMFARTGHDSVPLLSGCLSRTATWRISNHTLRPRAIEDGFQPPSMPSSGAGS